MLRRQSEGRSKRTMLTRSFSQEGFGSKDALKSVQRGFRVAANRQQECSHGHAVGVNRYRKSSVSSSAQETAKMRRR